MDKTKSRPIRRKLDDLWSKNTMLWVLILMQIVGAILSKGISVQPSNLINVLTRVAITAAVATGQAMVMISGGIDLTVGSIVILSAIILGGTTSTQSTSILPHIGLVPGILLAVVISLLIGLINGLIISRTKIPPFIVTLAMMLIVTGGTFLATLGVPIYDMSPWFAEFGRMRLLSVPYPIYLWLSLIGIATFILSKTRFGPMVYAIGGSEKAALLSAIDVKKIKVLVYMYSSLMAMIGGFLFIVRTYMIIPSATAGSEYLMDPIAASVIGGISLSGGKGTMKDVLIGILVLGFLLNLLHIMLLPTAYVQTIKGSIIIIAVIVNIYLSKRGI